MVKQFSNKKKYFFVINLRHTIFAPSYLNKYSGYSFPSLVDAINQYDKSSKKFAHVSNLVEDIKLRVSIICYRIQSAISTLKDPLDFQRYKI